MGGGYVITKYLATILLTLAVTLAIAPAVSATSPNHAVSKGVWETVFSMKDPRGDDKGPGTYSYPQEKGCVKGVFDIVGFDARYNRHFGIEFIINLSRIGGNPLNYSLGFSLQEIQIYVHGGEGYGSILTFGLNAVIRDPDAWQFAVILPAMASPWRAPLVIAYANGSVVKGPKDVRVIVKGNSIDIYIPMKYVEEWVNNMEHWRYVVVVTPFDPSRPYGVMKFEIVSSKHSVGGVSPSALNAGVAPAIMDILAPNASVQYRMLKSYNIKVGSPATLAAVPYLNSYSTPHPPVTITTTITTTVSTTLTHYVYTTLTTTSYYLHEYYGPMTWGLLGLAVLLAVVLAAVAERLRRASRSSG